MSVYVIKTVTNGVEDFQLVSGSNSHVNVISNVQRAILAPEVKVENVIEIGSYNLTALKASVKGASFALVKDKPLEKEPISGDAIYVVNVLDIYSDEDSMLFAGDESEAFEDVKEFVLRSMTSDAETIQIVKISKDLKKYCNLHPVVDGFNFTLA